MKKYDIKTTDTETLKKWYHLMVLGRALDEKAPSYLLQSLGWSYHAPYAGHDGIQLAVGQVFTKGEDFLFPYYRDMLTVLSAGMSVEELILNGISKATDPGSGGRHEQGKIERRLNIFVIYSFCKMSSQVNRKLLVAYGVLQCRLICRL